MRDISKFCDKISFIDFHIPKERQELVKELRKTLNFEKKRHREGIIELREENPPDVVEEENWFSTE